MEYNNAVLTLAPHGTPDPFVVFANDQFYMTYTTADHIQIWKSQTIDGFLHTNEKIIVWRPPPDTDHSAGIWAPELHAIGGRWYILYCAEKPGEGNSSHRMFLLGGPPSSQDPCMDVSTGAWEDLGHIQGMMVDQWAIDGTFFFINNALYMVYAGSPFGADLKTFKESELYIVRMNSPWSVATQPTRISAPTNGWEREGEQGINEGPEWLEAPDGSWKGIIYSAGGSWCQNYKMVALHYTGGDPIHPSSWHKDNKPFLVSGRSVHGPFGPGHGNFVNLGNETFAVFHATDRPTDGWENRKARCQRVAWTRSGPHMGGNVGILVEDVQAFHTGPSRSSQQKGAKEVWKDVKAGYRKYTSGW